VSELELMWKSVTGPNETFLLFSLMLPSLGRFNIPRDFGDSVTPRIEGALIRGRPGVVGALRLIGLYTTGVPGRSWDDGAGGALIAFLEESLEDGRMIGLAFVSSTSFEIAFFCSVNRLCIVLS